MSDKNIIKLDNDNTENQDLEIQDPTFDVNSSEERPGIGYEILGTQTGH